MAAMLHPPRPSTQVHAIGGRAAGDSRARGTRSGVSAAHLRDPRPAGREPENLRSGWKWEILPVYEEIRDSGANYFFEWLPAGEYTFKHRLRVTLAGTYRVSPAELQSMYAPEFAPTRRGPWSGWYPPRRARKTPRAERSSPSRGS